MAGVSHLGKYNFTLPIGSGHMGPGSGGFKKASKFLNADKCLIVTYDQESVIPCKGTDLQIQVVPIYKYLLSDR